MKKYNAPIVRTINLEMESIVAMSNMNREGNGQDLSNRRQSASDAIWGTEE